MVLGDPTEGLMSLVQPHPDWSPFKLIHGFPESRTFDVRKRVNKVEAMYWVELRVACKRSS